MPANLLSLLRRTPAPRRWLVALESRIVLLAVLVGLLSAAGAAAVVLHSAEQSIHRMVLTAARNDREATARLLGSKVAVVRDLLTAVAAQMPASAWRDGASMGRLLQERPALGGVFRAVYAAGLDGRILARVEAGRLDLGGTDISDRDYFRLALASGQPVISDVLRGRVIKAPVVVIATPVKNAEGRQVGVLAGSIALGSTALFERIGNQLPQATTLDLVIDRAGRLLAHPDPTRLMTQADADPALRPLLHGGTAAGMSTQRRAMAIVQGDRVVSMAAIPTPTGSACTCRRWTRPWPRWPRRGAQRCRPRWVRAWPPACWPACWAMP